jgi:hypothetical protein
MVTGGNEGRFRMDVVQGLPDEILDRRLSHSLNNFLRGGSTALFSNLQPIQGSF